jgi:hypothetical protein
MPNQISLTRSERIERLKKFAWWLDACLVIPGTQFRIGIESIVGLIPGIGDVLGALSSGFLVFEAWRMRVSSPLLLRMLLNIGVELLIGAIPIVGDVFDFIWKANQRNLALLERELKDPIRSHRRNLAFVVLIFLVISFMMVFVVSVVIAMVYTLRELISWGAAYVSNG